MSLADPPIAAPDARDGAFPVERLRAAFPALRAAGDFVFLDNAAGAQVPDAVVAAVQRHLVQHNVQRGGRYGRSLAVDETIAQARLGLTAFVGAQDPREIALGLNATSFIRQVSAAIGRTLHGSRVEIVVTDLDHQANIGAWRALEGAGARLRLWPMTPDGGLDVDDLLPLLSERTRLVACTAGSHALGTRIDVAAAAAASHAVGAQVFVDAVHYAPHGPIDVAAWGCDYLVGSGYKIFGPHMGFLWGRLEALAALPTQRESFLPDEPPYTIEAGTFGYESVAGMGAALGYLADLGGDRGELRARLVRGMQRIDAYEQGLSERMARRLGELGARVFGLADPASAARRLPTFLFDLPGQHPAGVAQAAADAGLGVRDGHMYAPALMGRLGLAMDRGAVRASLCHYNTAAEIDRFADVLRGLAS